MQVEKAKEIITKILGNEIKFEGHFNKIFKSMDGNQQNSLLDWIKNQKEGKGDAFPSPKFPDIYIFFYKSNVTNIRGILEKEKNKFFLRLFLDKHKIMIDEEENSDLGKKKEIRIIV